MSGDGAGVVIGGLFLIPFAAAAAVVAAVGAVAAGAIAAGNAVYKYTKARNEEINYQCEGLSQELGAFYSKMHRSIDAQNAMSENAYKALKADLESSAKAVEEKVKEMSADNTNALKQHMNSQMLRVRQLVDKTGQQVKEQYVSVISDNINQAKVVMTKSYNDAVSSIAALKNDIEGQKLAEKRAAESELKDAEGALKLLHNNYPDSNYASLEITVNKAKANFESGLYLAAFSAAHDAVLKILDETKNADERRRKHDAKVSEIIVLLEQAMAMLDNNKSLTFNIGNECFTEDLTAFSSGMYRKLEKRVSEVYCKIKDGKSDNMTEAQLDSIRDEILIELYPDINEVLEFSRMNMANAYLREDMGDVVVDALEAQGYRCIADVNRSDNRGEDLHLKFRNDVNGEEIVVKLSPVDLADGSINTGVEVEMFNLPDPGDERKKQKIRTVINSAVSNELGVQLNVRCDGKTVNTESVKKADADFESVRRKKERHD